MVKQRMPRVISLGFVLMFSVIIAGCGRDTSTVESALEGQWQLRDARINDQPIEEFVAEMEEVFGQEAEGESVNPEDITTETEFYFNEGQLIIVNAEGEETDMTYEITDTNEENNSLTIEASESNEELDMTLIGEGMFMDEERESLDFTITLNDITLHSSADENRSSLEAEFEQLGEQIAAELLQNIDFEIALDFVDNTTAPATRSEESQ